MSDLKLAGMTLLFVLATAALSACGGSAPQSTPDLSTHEWVLEAYGDPNNLTAASQAAVVTLNFDPAESNMFGSAGCNTYSASYELDGKAITTGPAMSTMMACSPEEVMDQEGAYLGLLGQATNYSLSGESLTLIAADGQILVFGP